MADQRTKKNFRIKLHGVTSDRSTLPTAFVLGKLREVYAARERAGLIPRLSGRTQTLRDPPDTQQIREPPGDEAVGGDKREEEDDVPAHGCDPLDDDEAWRICDQLAWALVDDKTVSQTETLSRLEKLPRHKRRQLALWFGAKAETLRAIWQEKKLTKNQSFQLVALGRDWLDTVLADEGMLAYTLGRLQRLDLQALLLVAED